MTPEPPPPEPVRDESPFITIWDDPRGTIRRIVDRNPWYRVHALFFASGIVGALDGMGQLPEEIPIPPVALPVLCAMTGLVAIGFGHLGAWYKRLVGRMLGGQAKQRECVAVAAWATVPTIVGHGALWLVRFALYGTAVLQPGPAAMDGSRLVQTALGLAAMLFSLWSLYVTIVAFAEVNRFSIGRSVATTVLTPLLILTAFLVILGAVIVYRAGRY